MKPLRALLQFMKNHRLTKEKIREKIRCLWFYAVPTSPDITAAVWNKLTKQFSDVITNSGNLFSEGITQRLLNTGYQFTPSAHALLLSCPFSSTLLCTLFLSAHLVHFLLSTPLSVSFWLNKLVSLMSSDTSGLSHSCLITKWL